MHGIYNTIMACYNPMFHLHGLQNDHGLSGNDHVAGCSEHVEDLPGHGRRQATGRSLGSGQVESGDRLQRRGCVGHGDVEYLAPAGQLVGGHRGAGGVDGHRVPGPRPVGGGAVRGGLLGKVQGAEGERRLPHRRLGTRAPR